MTQVDSRLVFRLDRLTIVYNTGAIRALNNFLDVGERPAAAKCDGVPPGKAPSLLWLVHGARTALARWARQ